MLRLKRVALSLAALATAAVPLALNATPAQASHSQVALLEADANLKNDPGGAMAQLHSLGVGMVRVYVEWSAIAPDSHSRTRPAGDPADDNSSFYRPGAWNYLDAVVHAALQNHVQLDFVLSGGAPYWADGADAPFDGGVFNQHYAWKPDPGQFGAWTHAVGHRYGGYVHLWELFNEPNFGEDLGPQAVNGSQYSLAPGLYRTLSDVAYSALRGTTRGQQTIVIGNLAARGLGPSRSDPSHPEGLPGNFGQTKPLQFIRTLYCVDRSLHPLQGGAATTAGCPTTAAGRRAFRASHPVLFNAGGFGIHPYPQGLPPTQEASHDRDYVAFNEIPRLETQLDRLLRLYGSSRRLPIYNNEYGYVTSPPARKSFHFASPERAAVYINWAEYLSWRDPRIASTMQYLLTDPAENGPSQFFSGIETSTGGHKPGYQAYQMPLFLPNTTARRRRALEVWGCVRPAHFYSLHQQAAVQWGRGQAGPWQTVKTLTIRDAHGYFDTRVVFPASGYLRIAWKRPGGGTETSRTQAIRVR